MPGISIFLNVALKSPVVLGVAWLLAFVLRGRSAAARHLVWTAAAAAVVALPLLSISLPSLRVSAPAALAPINTGLVFRVFGVAAADNSTPAPTLASGSARTSVTDPRQATEPRPKGAVPIAI